MWSSSSKPFSFLFSALSVGLEKLDWIKTSTWIKTEHGLKARMVFDFQGQACAEQQVDQRDCSRWTMEITQFTYQYNFFKTISLIDTLLQQTIYIILYIISYISLYI